MVGRSDVVRRGSFDVIRTGNRMELRRRTKCPAVRFRFAEGAYGYGNGSFPGSGGAPGYDPLDGACGEGAGEAPQVTGSGCGTRFAGGDPALPVGGRGHARGGPASLLEGIAAYSQKVVSQAGRVARYASDGRVGERTWRGE